MTLVDINIRLTGRPGGKDLLVPGLVSDYGVVMPLLHYFEYIYDDFAPGTLKPIRHAFKLFFQFTEATAPDGFGSRKLHGRTHAEHFLSFRRAMVLGTINEESLEDSSGLRWPPGRISKANRVVFYLTEFFTWADGKGANDAQRFNPVVQPSGYQDLMARAAFEHRRSRAFLGHTWHGSGEHVVEGRYTGRVREPGKVKGSTKRFPDAHFLELLALGFRTRSLSNLRDVLVTILMNKGGLRVSEPLHIWLTDIAYDPKTEMAYVAIPHPSNGTAPGLWGSKYKTRAQCLEAEFRRRPRSKLGSGNPEYAGWKSGVGLIQVLWCEPIWGKYFWRLWQVYLRRVQELVPAASRQHPYAFMVFAGKTLGRPLTTAAFRDAHEKAVFRANLVPREGVPDLKNLGLTEHGHRHAYGNRARNEAELSPHLVQDMMNHSSIESQKSYTLKTWSEKMDFLSSKITRMHERDDLLQEFLQAFE
ncbi:tyrosine-type recombinase/integrase [Roseateles sp. PN1]|uniref:tyrosine-type recombinase/integrase n=1 Tax=Roseateles sp. PN1 TaxID=3137372 RepID=UPI00313A17F6